MCSATAIDYNDGDLTSQISYEWTVNGLPIANSDSYQASASDANVWDMITCTAYVMDSDLEMTNASTSVQFDNTAPTLSGIQITGGTGSYYNDEVLFCSANLFDPNETLIASYSWTAGSQVLSTTDNLDLIVTALLPSDALTCSISASDSQGSSVQDSITVSIGDRAPETPTVNITWGSGTSVPDETQTLLCSASGGTDPDGETHSYAYSWTSDLGGSVTGAAVYSSQTQLSETWTCEVSSTAGALSSTGSSSVTIDSGWTGEREFNTCAQTGGAGPSQSQCTSAYTGTTLDGEVTVSSGIQSWTVPSNGTYLIEVWGARGGDKPDGFNAIGGNGAMVSGEFQLTQGDVIKILVGQMGNEPSGANSSGGSGGGGGSFVFYDVNDTNPLIVAGGGGGLGAGNSSRVNGLPGLIGTSGSNSSGGIGGQNGSGGSVSTANYNSGGGAGWLSNGANGSHPNFAGGGETPSNGGLGGVRGRISHSADGGFGGGAGTNDGGGGGGGYSGGDGGCWCSGQLTSGGGGGSYNAGTNQLGTSGYNSDDGRVFIDKL